MDLRKAVARIAAASSLAIVFAVPAGAPRPAAAIALAAPSRAAAAVPRRPHAAVSCASLVNRTFPPYRALIVSATPSVTHGSGAAFCDVIGTIEGTIDFELALPTAWTARLYVSGNGGFAGEPLTHAKGHRDLEVAAGYAFAISDTGHQSASILDASWAANDPTAVANWAERSVHELTTEAKAIVATYYGSSAAHAYYEGCSTGGQQAYTEAEKFPADFDGIVGGDPNLGGANTYVAGMATAQAEQMLPITGPELVPTANAIMAACDGLDGLNDNIISDPRRCPAFDPKTMRGNLTPQQAAEYKSYLGGLYNSYGFLEYGGAQGAEYSDGLVGVIIPNAQGAAVSATYAQQYAEYLAPYPKTAENEFSISTFNASVDPYEMTGFASIDDADNPDLRAFFGHGGKLIGYHGWADPLIPPWFTVAYYESVIALLQLKATTDSYRLFMVPGMGHCMGSGYGANEFDALDPLVAWVETGKAPDSIAATRYTPQGAVQFQRLLCAYPNEGTYVGGDPTKLTSFACKPGLRGVPYPPRGKPIPEPSSVPPRPDA